MTRPSFLVYVEPLRRASRAWRRHVWSRHSVQFSSHRGISQRVAAADGRWAGGRRRAVRHPSPAWLSSAATGTHECTSGSWAVSPSRCSSR